MQHEVSESFDEALNFLILTRFLLKLQKSQSVEKLE